MNDTLQKIINNMKTTDLFIDLAEEWVIENDRILVTSKCSMTRQEAIEASQIVNNLIKEKYGVSLNKNLPTQQEHFNSPTYVLGAVNKVEREGK